MERTKITTTIVPASEYTAERATITVELSGGRTVSVEVWGPETRFGSLSPASVNWSAIGPVSAADATAYAAAIAEAARVAETLAPEGLSR